MRSSVGRPVGLHQRGCAGFGLLGHRLPSALVTQKMARALGLAAIPSSPLRLEGIGEGHRPRAATRFKVPLVDTGGRTIVVTAYGVDVIMSPLTGGDAAPMRETFPEVPLGGLVSASGEVSLLMGQDNLSLSQSSGEERVTPRCT